ncbi:MULTISPECIES: phosphorylcholine transferase LicD [unclassified Acinetobacter]|uniref:LicD family protein n=1 Tax=unclassified Acinetobacter TaxID=196816 RepID=UPI0015D1B35E|nr:MULTISPECIES: LicD family protein [unclassified Acinetobacter]
MNNHPNDLLMEDFSRYNGEGTMLRKAQKRLLEMLIDFDHICRKYNIQYFLSGGTCLGAVRHGGFIPWDDDVDIDIWYEDYQKLVDVLNKEASVKYFVQTYSSNKAFGRTYIRLVDRSSKVMYKDNSTRDNFLYHGLWLDVLPLKKCYSYRLKKNIDRFYVASMMHKAAYVKRSHIKRFVAFMIYPIIKFLVLIFQNLFSRFAPENKISHIFGTGITPKLNKSHCFPVKEIFFEGHAFLGPANPHKYLENLYGKDYMVLPSEQNRKQHALSIEIG